MREVATLSTTGEEEMLSVSHLTGVTPRSEKTVYMFEAESTVGYKKVAPGDLVINTMWAWMGAAGTAQVGGIVSPAYGVYRIDTTVVDPRWVDYVIRTPRYVTEMTRHSRGVTSSRLRLYPDEFLRLSMPVPPLAEQREIADYLDVETARIDALIAKKQQLVHLVEERRQRLTLAGVLGELTYAGRARASGLEWGSDVPAHWEVALLRLVARQGTGHTPSRTHPEWWIAEECVVPWVTTGEVQQVRSDRARVITETREKISHVGIANSSAEIHPAGTVFLCRTASAGYSGIMGADMATSQDFATWTCEEQLDPDYLLFCLRAMRPDLLGRLATGSTHKTIYMPEIQGLRVPVPPVDEQRAIAERLKTDSDKSFAAADALVDQIALLVEHRQALVTAAVTGSLTVPGAA